MKNTFLARVVAAVADLQMVARTIGDPRRVAALGELRQEALAELEGFRARCPPWVMVYTGVLHTWDRDGEPVLVSRETARLALDALDQVQDHNRAAAAGELWRVLET